MLDELQEVLGTYHGAVLHSHRCRGCGKLCACAQTQCQARWDAKLADEWECFICRDKREGRPAQVEWADTLEES
jgi:hypothetical protein